MNKVIYLFLIIFSLTLFACSQPTPSRPAAEVEKKANAATNVTLTIE